MRWWTPKWNYHRAPPFWPWCLIRYVNFLLFDSSIITTKSEEDEDNDGTIDRKNTYVRDASGLPIRYEYDHGNDGTINSVEHYTYVRLN
jgi:hypothetical protein